MNNGSDISDADLAALFGLSTDEADALGIDPALATSPDHPPHGPDQQAPILDRHDGPLDPLGPGEQASQAATVAPPPTEAAPDSLSPAAAPGVPTPLRRIQPSAPPPADAPPALQPGSQLAGRPSGEPSQLLAGALSRPSRFPGQRAGG